jgi:hypothetical protein
VDKAKTAKEEARELLLKEESSVREKVGHVQKNLALMLDALGELAIANPIFTHGQLPHLVSNPTLALSSFLFVLPCNAVVIFFNVLHHNIDHGCQKMFCGAFISKPRKLP